MFKAPQGVEGKEGRARIAVSNQMSRFRAERLCWGVSVEEETMGLKGRAALGHVTRSEGKEVNVSS